MSEWTSGRHKEHWLRVELGWGSDRWATRDMLLEIERLKADNAMLHSALNFAEGKIKACLEVEKKIKNENRNLLKIGFIGYLKKQIAWSRKTFGPGRRTVGICKHIESELKEIQANPGDLFEWLDVVILALDGAWRAGFTSEEIIEGLKKKQTVNFRRKYKQVSQNEPSFHCKSHPCKN